MAAMPQLLWNGPPTAERTILLAHGAGAGMDTPFMNHFAEGLAEHGLRVGRFEFPYMAARRQGGRRSPPDKEPVLREAWQRGAVLCGVSAGMLCWFNGGVTDSFGALDALRDGLGLIDATACPHYDAEAQRRPTYHRLVGEGLQWGYAADDGAAGGSPGPPG